MKKKDWQDMQQIETDFSEWLVKNKVNESIGVLIDTCVEYMDKPFYEWYEVWDPHDSSGDIRKTGEQNKDRCHTLKEIMDAYTGDRRASYVSGCGWFFDDVEDVWEFEMLEKIFKPFLLEFIDEKREWLMSFEEVRRAVEDKDFREDNCIPETADADEAIRQYLCFEDVVGDSNVSLMCKLEEVIESISEDIFNQIQERYKEKSR